MTFKRSFGIGRLFRIVRRSGDVLSEEVVRDPLKFRGLCKSI